MASDGWQKWHCEQGESVVSDEECKYSRTPLIRPPSESHWCGRIRGMVAREGFVYKQNAQFRHTKCGRMRGMVVGEGGRSSGVLLYTDREWARTFPGIRASNQSAAKAYCVACNTHFGIGHGGGHDVKRHIERAARYD